MATPTPVSWLMIEPGWRVESADGEEIGHVEQVTGDSSADIFDGLSIGSHLLSRPHYVAAEDVAGIFQGCVRLKLDRASVVGLPGFVEPATQEEVEPEKASLVGRAEEHVVAEFERERRPGLLRRMLDWLGVADRR